jgi:hypothetical protein
MNLILDRLPTDYNGYLIRTSFRIGMQICLCFDDNELTDEEKLSIALNLLYGNGIPEINVAMDGLSWYMSCGMKQNKETTNNKTLFYWDFDAPRLYSSFLQTYGIDLTTADIHWFKFIAMMGSLNKDSALSQAIEIRNYDTKDLKGKAKLDMIKMKKSLTPPVELSDEEQQRIEEFNALLSGGDING